MNDIRCHGIPCFQFYLLFRENGIREELDENDYCLCYGVLTLKVPFWEYLITGMFKVLSQQLRGTLATAFEKHVTTEYFIDMDKHRCQAWTKTFDLLLNASLSLKQA